MSARKLFRPRSFASRLILTILVLIAVYGIGNLLIPELAQTLRPIPLPEEPITIPPRGPVDPAYIRPEFSTTFARTGNLGGEAAIHPANIPPQNYVLNPPINHDEFNAQIARGATFTVNFMGDDSYSADTSPGDGICADSFGACGLRTAIMETNALASLDQIIIPAGTITLGRTGRDEDLAVTGDLDITDDLAIYGAGADQTIINGNDIDRVFHIFAPAGAVSLVDFVDLSITNGDATLNTGNKTGGGILATCRSDLWITRVGVFSNRATYGGGVEAGACTDGGSATFLMKESAVYSNEGTSTGGIKTLYGANLTVINSTVSNNFGLYSGGIVIEAAGYTGTVTIDQSTVSDNYATTMGIGGLNYITGPATVTVSNSQLVYNLDNTSGTPNQSDCGGLAFASGGDNVYRNGAGCTVAATDIVNPFPGVGSLAYNSPGQTPSNAIFTTSSAYNQNGDACAATDQRGVTRPQSTACDIGSFELTNNTDPGSFDLIAPLNYTTFDQGYVGNFVWQRASDHLNYDFYIIKGATTVLAKYYLTPAADADQLMCAAPGPGSFSKCTLVLNSSDQAVLSGGNYTWTVYAYDDNNGIEANNARFNFAVTATPTITPTYTHTWTHTPTPSITPSRTYTSTYTPTGSISPTPTRTHTPTFTSTLETPTPTDTTFVTETPSATTTPDITPTDTPTLNGVELLPNTSFEVDTNEDKIPDGWTGSLLTGDGRKCNKPDKIFAYDGECAVRFKGSSGENSKFSLKLPADSAAVGDTLYLSAYIRTQSTVVGGTVVTKGKYEDGTTKYKLQISVPTGTTPYTPYLVGPLVLSDNIAKLKVSFGYKGVSGKYFIDLLSLIKQSPGNILSLP